MAKARVSTNPMYTGGAGGYSFYVRQSEQIVRQRKNNSNYGETARRTWAQMERRVRWANLVNLYKACQSWMPKAFETKSGNQTDYNVFMQLNVNSNQVALTKDNSRSGDAVWEPVQVSRGSLPSVSLAYDAATFRTVSDIAISNAISAATTIAQLSTDVLANNPSYQRGDNIAIILCSQQYDRNAMTCKAWSAYNEVTLDVNDQTRLSDVLLSSVSVSRSQGGFLQFNSNDEFEIGWAVIHTRKSGGKLLVSSQSVVVTDSGAIGRFSDPEWVEAAILTYGLDADVLLAPGSGAGGGGAAQPLYLRSANLGGDDVNLIVTGDGSYIQFRDSGSSVASVPAILVASGQIQLLDGSDVESDLTWGYVTVPSSTVSANVVQISYGGRDYVINLNTNTITPAITAVYPS